MNRAIFSLCLALAGLLGTGDIRAAAPCEPDDDPTTIIVPAEAPTLQAGIDAAPDGGTVLLCDGVYSGSGFSDVSIVGRDLTIGSLSGDPTACTLDGLSQSRLMTITASTIRLDGLHLTNGRTTLPDGGGAIFAVESSLSATNSRFVSNAASYGDSGGALRLSTMGTVEFVNCDFERNSVLFSSQCAPAPDNPEFRGSPGTGGAMRVTADALIIRDCAFTENESGGGHAIYGGAGTVDIEGTTFEANQRTLGGEYWGAVVLTSPELNITGCTFANNSAEERGGALSCGGSDEVRITDTLFEENDAYSGTAISGGSHVIATNCVFRGNSGHSGGTISNVVSLELVGCEFREDDSEYGGCAVNLPSGTVTATDCRFENSYYGVNVVAGTNVTLTRCEFVNNRAGCVRADDTTITDCVFLDNDSNCYDSTIFSTNATISGTTFSSSYGCNDPSVLTVLGDLNLDRCIVAFSNGTGNPPIVCGGTTTVTCTNIYGNEQGDWVGCLTGLAGVDGNFSADPLFCGPPDSGPLTLAASSPCLPGNHPDGVDCGLIGALGEDCPIVSTEEVDALPVETALRVTGPNPFTTAIALRVELPAEAAGTPVVVRVFDAAGRRVRTLRDEVAVPGRFDFSWDGRDDGGRPESSGVYFIRLESGDRTRNARVLLVR